MISVVRGKNLKLNPLLKKQVEKKAQKIETGLLAFSKKWTILDLKMGRNKARDYFEGTLLLVLPHKVLFSKGKSKDPTQLLDLCFDKLEKEIEKYKGKHFAGYSKYFNHKTIRKAGF